MANAPSIAQHAAVNFNSVVDKLVIDKLMENGKLDGLTKTAAHTGQEFGGSQAVASVLPDQEKSI